MRTLRPLRVGLVGLALCVGIASCGGDDDGTDGSSDTNDGGSSSSSALVDEASAKVEELSQPLDSIGLSEPLEALPEGKSVIFVTNPNPVVLASVSEFERAGEVLGLDVSTIDGGLAPDTYAAAVQTAVERDPDMIFTIGYPPDAYADIIQPYLDGGGLLLGDAFGTPELDPRVEAEWDTSAMLEEMTRAEANWVVADSGGDANVVYFGVPDYPVQVGQMEAFEDEMGRLCPDCTVHMESVPATDLGTGVPGKVVSFLQRNPDTNYIVVGFGDVAVGVPEAMNAAGITGVRGVSHKGAPANHEMVKNENVFVTDLSHPLGAFGWYWADGVARAFAGQEIEQVQPYGTPMQFLTAEDIDFDTSELWDGGFDWESQFRELWGV